LEIIEKLESACKLD